ncbi:Hypothetical predicted protein [Mytilus galloprovincialis]|uniref:Immunoglobulin subtype domain-containing protein n=1 Tax=Mytilus galloprovincialis TaxID=29158 RepID=A0A8B6HJT0_MYTGA|nr:Hypothetical predicted protein [Mytilus galloprovincialis]
MESEQILLTMLTVLVCNIVCRSEGTSLHKNKISIEGFINENELTLICHVKDLFLQVDILHESKCEAKCYPPYPRSTCFSYNKGDITQNLKTNCTKLVVRLDEKKYKSFWSCQHGSNGEKSDQILVQKEDNTSSRDPSLEKPFLIALIVVATISIGLCVVISFLITCIRRRNPDTAGVKQDILLKQTIT